jgi:hypothetical protein
MMLPTVSHPMPSSWRTKVLSVHCASIATVSSAARLRPRNHLRGHAAARAVHPPDRVPQTNLHPGEVQVPPAPLLSVVRRPTCPSATAAADFKVRVRRHAPSGAGKASELTVGQKGRLTSCAGAMHVAAPKACRARRRAPRGHRAPFLATKADGKQIVKLLDLNTAESLIGGPKLTAAQMLLGSPRYMAPEQPIAARRGRASTHPSGIGGQIDSRSISTASNGASRAIPRSPTTDSTT